jgi:hypothetical protein
MRTPRYIATVSSVVLGATMLIISVVSSLRGEAVLGHFGVAALESVLLCAFAWPGTYLGAKYSTPHQRSDLFTRVLSLTFLAIGIVMSIPFKTHAVKLDMPSTTHAGSSAGFDWSTVLFAVFPLALVAVIPFVLTRALAIAIAKVSRP